MFKFLTKRITAVLYFSLSSSISLFVLLLISIFATWLIRGWLVVSGVDWKFSTNFVFQPCTQVGVCSYPWAVINLHRAYSPSNSILTPGLPYTAALRFRISDSEANRLAGMFMLKFSLEDAAGQTVSSCMTSTLMPYRSFLIRIARRLILWPFMIFDYLQEYHSIYVRCPDPISFTYDDPALRLRVEVQNIGVQMANDGMLELSGHLRGLQYYLYWWPILSSCALFCLIFWCSTTASCGVWLVRSVTQSLEPKAVELPSPPVSPTWKKRQLSPAPSLPFADDDFQVPPDQGRQFSPMRRRWENPEEDDPSCFQRRLSSRMQRALLDLDDSNLGS